MAHSILSTNVHGDSHQRPVPLHIRNAETQLMKDAGYGKGYIYAHDTEEKITRMQCLADALKDRRYYDRKSSNMSTMT